MASTNSSLHSQIPLSRPFSTQRNRGASTTVSAIRREADDQNYDGRFVDENTIVLRKRIHEMKVMEKNYEPPSKWMDWEKRFYANYDAIIPVDGYKTKLGFGDYWIDCVEFAHFNCYGYVSFGEGDPGSFI